MDVIYKCHCMKDEVTITVQDRHPDGDLGDWMTLAQHAIGVDHRARSPVCAAKAVEYVKIPYEEGAGVGQRASRQ